ncbi:hypothetical protein NIES2100_38920 [Calothrix sp. NIES-2100]|nr:hypothetical protein NIES2100_38920 [Calothrix sp. NIES-2100]
MSKELQFLAVTGFRVKLTPMGKDASVSRILIMDKSSWGTRVNSFFSQSADDKGNADEPVKYFAVKENVAYGLSPSRGLPVAERCICLILFFNWYKYFYAIEV